MTIEAIKNNLYMEWINNGTGILSYNALIKNMLSNKGAPLLSKIWIPLAGALAIPLLHGTPQSFRITKSLITSNHNPIKGMFRKKLIFENYQYHKN